MHCRGLLHICAHLSKRLKKGGIGTVIFGWKQAGKWVERGWNVLKMACHRMGAIIGHPGTVSNGHNTFWAEPELESFFK